MALVAGCATQTPGRGGAPEVAPDLLTGERLFGSPVTLADEPGVDILAISPEMQAFVDDAVETDDTQLATRFYRLFRALVRNGYFDSTYAADRTLTAAETFEGKAGNCLSYTNMFVALARAAGLNALYQIVDVPPTWDADSGFLIRYTHINVLIRGVRLDVANGDSFTVDFNSVHPDPEYPRYVVSDDYARSLYYANRSVARVREGDVRDGFALLQRAIAIEPRNIDLWINLGALYATQADYDASIQSYFVALGMDRNNKSAMSGLARSYQNSGQPELAAPYIEQVRNYRDRNPYFHFALAQGAYEDGNYAKALEYIDRAIRRKRTNARFHFMKGLVQAQLGDTEAARKSFRRAQRYGDYRDLKLRYVQSLAGAGADVVHSG
ncbi:MAG: tetratricopeptide repeat protein [Pseudomonadales bacterium]